MRVRCQGCSNWSFPTHRPGALRGARRAFRKACLSLVAATTIAAPACAAVQGEGFYGGLGGGWASINTVRFNIRPPAAPLSGETPTSNSAAVNVAVGYKFNPPVRVEAEVRYTDFNVDRPPSMLSRFPGPKGDLGVTSFFVNGLYDYPLTPRFAISIGGGLGAGLANANIPITNTASITRTGSGFAWQGIAGLTFVLSNSLEIQADYRYHSIDSTSHDFASVMGASATLGQKNIHSAMLNFRWFLSAAEPPREPVQLPPPPPPPPPPKPSTYVVFFDFDRSELTPEALQVVAAAAETAKSEGMVRVVITGHTDTVGSASYNQRLSERRAVAVKTALVTDGIPANDIATIGKGFNDPLVPTGPNVREPQNRRAVIELGPGATS